MTVPDDDALVLAVDGHVAVHVVRQGVDVRWVLVLGLKCSNSLALNRGRILILLLTPGSTLSNGR